MDKAIYDKISKRWTGKIYQEWRRMPDRFALLGDHIELLRGKDVLEAGSNAGLFAYEIAKVANSYVGIEQFRDYYKQSKVTKRYIENSRVGFVMDTLGGFINKSGFSGNAFVSFYVLYHLSDAEIDALKTQIMPKCDIVFTMIRDKGDKVLTHNKYALWKTANVLDLFCDFHNSVYSIDGKQPTLIVSKK